MATIYSQLILITAIAVGGCAADTVFRANESDPSEPSVSTTPAPDASTTTGSDSDPAAQPSAAQTRDTYADAIDRASGAVSLSQSARSKDDWRLVASRWQQAIALLEAVPEADPNSGAATQKLTDYRRNLTYAQQQADIPIPKVEPGRVVRLSPNGEEVDPDAEDSVTSAATSSSAVPRPQSSNAQSTPSASGLQRYQAPIVRRAGGTPVILATFNGNQPFEMIVDTGASGTVITQAMAQTLNVDPVGEAKVATASANNVPFQLGYVTSLEVSGAQVGELLVAIAGPELSVGLLGQDFFSDYDVTIREDVVEFRER